MRDDYTVPDIPREILAGPCAIYHSHNFFFPRMARGRADP
jgi:hypothetical protein